MLHIYIDRRRIVWKEAAIEGVKAKGNAVTGTRRKKL